MAKQICISEPVKAQLDEIRKRFGCSYSKAIRRLMQRRTRINEEISAREKEILEMVRDNYQEKYVLDALAEFLLTSAKLKQAISKKDDWRKRSEKIDAKHKKAAKLAEP